MHSSEARKVDNDQDTYLGKPILMALDSPNKPKFAFKEKASEAKKYPWIKEWQIIEVRRGDEKRAFFAIRGRDAYVVLLKYYPVHPDEEGGYNYEKDIINAMNKLSEFDLNKQNPGVF